MNNFEHIISGYLDYNEKVKKLKHSSIKCS
jgi:hypothetical protein